MVERTPVTSRMINSVGYDAEKRSLFVEFNNGKIYEYFDVPEEEYENLLAASSKGQYMRQHVLEQYKYAPVD